MATAPSCPTPPLFPTTRTPSSLAWNKHRDHYGVAAHSLYSGRNWAPPRLTGLRPVVFSIVSGPRLNCRGFMLAAQSFPISHFCCFLFFLAQMSAHTSAHIICGAHTRAYTSLGHGRAHIPVWEHIRLLEWAVFCTGLVPHIFKMVNL